MKYFIIDIPYVSGGLRQTYNKKIEIYEQDKESCILHYQTSKTKEWKTKKASKHSIRISTLSDIIANKYKGYRSAAFASFEEAYLAKIYLIDQMRKVYLAELQDLQDRMTKNCPDVSTEVAELEAKHPEYFI